MGSEELMHGKLSPVVGHSPSSDGDETRKVEDPKIFIFNPQSRLASIHGEV